MPLNLATQRRLRGSSQHLSFARRQIPEEFIVDRGEVRFTSPEFTAVDLIPDRGADVVDEVLRLAGGRSAPSLAMMHAALAATPHRRGNDRRRRVLHSSRGRPWSEAERQLHVLLRRWRLAGWEANYHVFLGGRSWFVDVAFPQARAALEFDSREFHLIAKAFETDREKLNELEAAGWRVLQLTWAMLQNPDRIRRWLRAILPAPE
ncbi:MAG: DUF559 domain-containing protein [Propionibacteriaceae bacterium]|nr:DUF559 domain-containing protein [Propionibacteriaceae bacterium]